MYADNEEVQAAACLAVTLVSKRRRRRQEQSGKRKYWVKDWIKRRDNHGFMQHLTRELHEGDESLYRNFLRMAAPEYDYLLEKVTPLIHKQDTKMRKAISPAERLAVTLRYLATGDSYKSLMYLFRIPANTISVIVPQVCQAIIDALKGEYMKVPGTEDEWLAIAKGFEDQWNFPNCIGALDGKHVKIQAPAKSGSLYFNYKQSHSIILMALADANYRFTYINVGAPGRESDGGVYASSVISDALESNTWNVPADKNLGGRELPVPYVIVADDAFPLKPYLMKPYATRNQSVSERIFNYRLSRARRIIENSFGIISARFRVLRKTMEISKENVKKIVYAICVLHNFLLSRTNSMSVYAPTGTFDIENSYGSITPGGWRSESTDLLPLQQSLCRNPSVSAKDIREEYKQYFCREGAVPWQLQRI